jgi:hypothetical protein
MTEENQPENTEASESEIDSLQARAKLMGIKHHPNMGVTKLKALVNARLEGEGIEDEDEDPVDEVEPVEPVVTAPVVATVVVADPTVDDDTESTALIAAKALIAKHEAKTAKPVTVAQKLTGKEKKVQRAYELRERAKKAKGLVRIRLTCMNPAKADWNGEIYTVQNRLVGTIRKFVPFNVDAWHVPGMLYEFLKNKQCQTFHTVKLDNGVKVRQGRMVPEFAIEVLPPLDQKEIDQIATRQAAQGTMEGNR